MTEMPFIEIDEHSGFCFGVINAIKNAEKALEDKGSKLYCLGDIVHNDQELQRLENKGMKTIAYDEFKELRNERVLFRAHGEAPNIYEWAKERNIKLIDATCPVVVQLQKKILKKYIETKEENAQIVIYGKQGHAEVNGLVGQTNGEAIVISSLEDIEKLDMNRPIILFSQTTQNLKTFGEIVEKIEANIGDGVKFEYQDTICRQVSNRVPHIQEFAKKHELIFFVAGHKSSNGKVLFSYSQKANPRSYHISNISDIKEDMLYPMPKSIGICGATSTPMWQMEDVAKELKRIISEI